MYCPSCKKHYDEGLFCSICGTKLIEDPQVETKGFSIGDANAISGGVNLNDSHNVSNITNTTNTSHVVNNISNVERQKTAEELLQEKKNRFLSECKRAYEDGVLEQSEQIELEKLRVELDLDADLAKQLFNSVKAISEKNSLQRPMTPVAKVKLKLFSTTLRNNNIEAVKTQLSSIEILSQTFIDEDLQYKYYLALSVVAPERCIEKYESETIDKYWKSYWSYVAYLKLGKREKADMVLMKMANFTNYPEDNLTLLATIGALLQGETDEAKAYLAALLGEYSPNLQTLADTLYLLVEPEVAAEMGATEEKCTFYLQNIFHNDPEKRKAEEEAKRKEEDTINEIKLLWESEKYAEAYPMLQKLADQGHIKRREQCMLGFCYYCGWGVEENNIKAVEWFTKAAEQGYDKAQFMLGSCYYNGVAVEEDKNKAVEWYQKAAEQGFDKAQYKLGNCYACGYGIEKKRRKSCRMVQEIGRARK